VRAALGIYLGYFLKESPVISVTIVHSQSEHAMVYQFVLVQKEFSTFKQRRSALAVLFEATKIILAYFERVVLSYMTVITITCKHAANRQVS
jgi:hypothetical protein